MPCSHVLALTALTAPTLLSPMGPQEGDGLTERATATVSEISAAFGDKQKKYESLAKDVERAVGKLGAPDHPWVALVDELAEAGKADSKRKKNDKQTQEWLGRFPWGERLEFDLGLDKGSDRPIPDHEKGFIELGAGSGAFPGFPDLIVNEYLWGLDEIAGWQERAEVERGPAFEGRSAKDAVRAAEELPALVAIQHRLLGYPPELSLYALPELKRRLHRRLAERRRGDGDEPHSTDVALAFFDSKWNGFALEVPWTDEPLTIVRPAHALFSRDIGFLSHYPRAVELSKVGDVPFMSVQSMAHHAAEFGGGSTDASVYVGKDSGSPLFIAESAWLSRYKVLLEIFAFALLAPDTRYPEYLRIYDYPGGKAPEERGAWTDITREHALLVWALAEGDPARAADWLHDELLSLEANACPADVALPAAFTVLVRERMGELLGQVAERVRTERAAGGGEPGPFELRFSPFPVHGELEGEPGIGELVHSFHTHHAPATEAAREAAWAAVDKALKR